MEEIAHIELFVFRVVVCASRPVKRAWCEVEGVTNTLYTKAVSESGELTEVSPADTDVLDGELVD